MSIQRLAKCLNGSFSPSLVQYKQLCVCAWGWNQLLICAKPRHLVHAVLQKLYIKIRLQLTTATGRHSTQRCWEVLWSTQLLHNSGILTHLHALPLLCTTRQGCVRGREVLRKNLQLSAIPHMPHWRDLLPCPCLYNRDLFVRVVVLKRGLQKFHNTHPHRALERAKVF